MSSVNLCVIMGRIGQDPKIATAKNDTVIANFSVATSRKPKNSDEVTTWHNVRAFGRTAEVIRDYCSKGSLVHIEGTIDNGSYEGKDGQTKYYSQILVNRLTLMPKEKGQQSNSKPAQSQQQSGGSDDFEDVPFSSYLKGWV